MGRSTDASVMRRVAALAVALGIAFAFLAAVAGPALAVEDPYGDEAEVLPSRIDRGVEGGQGGDEVAGLRISNQRDRSTLPFTGADIMLFAITGAAATGTGTLLLRRSRPDG